MSKLSNKNSLSNATRTAVSAVKGKGPNAVEIVLDGADAVKAKYYSSSADGENEVEAGRIQLVEIPVGDIVPRSINNYKQSKIDKLAASIRATNNRLINPIIVGSLENLKDKELLAEYEKQGTDLSQYKYYIVSGERRFRAWNMLRDEELKKNHGGSTIFDTITANILGITEMQKEKKYYGDSNLSARQLTPLEILLNEMHVFDGIDSNEKKRLALIEMNNGSDEGIDADPDVAAKGFAKERYVKFYLEEYFGITDWAESTLKTNLWVASKCSRKVIDAILADTYSTFEAKRIGAYSEEEQNELLDLYMNDRAAYEARLTPQKKTEKATYRKRELLSVIQKDRKALEAQKKKYEEIYGSVCKPYDRTVKDILKYYDKIIGDLNVVIDSIK